MVVIRDHSSPPRGTPSGWLGELPTIYPQVPIGLTSKESPLKHTFITVLFTLMLVLMVKLDETFPLPLSPP